VIFRGHPRFSVLTACFGHERFVDSAIRSVWRQTVGDFEIIAVDDGSLDHTGTLLDALAAESRVPMRELHAVNRGADKAFNIAAKMATGAYLAFLNDDDEYAPDRLDAFCRVIDNPIHSPGASRRYRESTNRGRYSDMTRHPAAGEWRSSCPADRSKRSRTSTW
jgi:glycosyltransferase involved in cell wall biosynthesis